MNDNPEANKQGQSSQADQHSALLANLILQQSNMAMLLMGRTKHQDLDKPIKDLEAARLFIDQLEMLEAKTKGNLTKDESALLGQTLMALRLEFVQAVESESGDKKPVEKPAAPEPAPAPEAGKPAEQPEESHKKFSKKY
jgi:hypothetical protein